MVSALSSIIQQKLSKKFRDVTDFQVYPIGGGSINDTYCISLADKKLFCKINSATKFPHLFDKEKSSLEIIATQNIIHTPSVVDSFETEDKQFLLLEWIASGDRSESFWKLFGEKLAALHHVSNEYFGLEEDNFMGSVPQSNAKHKKWTVFFATQRLEAMVKKCEAKGLLSKTQLTRFEILQSKLPVLFEEEPPSLLHGDLWSGNYMCNQASEPVLIDPAVYFGHRSMDLAMTTLFGCFQQTFYEAYHYHFPLPSNYKEQWAICNLYPLLIHLYLFGTSYLSQIDRTLKLFT